MMFAGVSYARLNVSVCDEDCYFIVQQLPMQINILMLSTSTLRDKDYLKILLENNISVYKRLSA